MRCCPGGSEVVKSFEVVVYFNDCTDAKTTAIAKAFNLPIRHGALNYDDVPTAKPIRQAHGLASSEVQGYR
jgi:hypothetical protein